MGETSVWARIYGSVGSVELGLLAEREARADAVAKPIRRRQLDNY